MPALPPALHAALERRFGTVTSTAPVAGGDTYAAARVDTAGAGPLFVKFAAGAPGRTYAAEADGLATLRARASAMAPGALHVPEPLAYAAPVDACPGYLVLPWLRRGRADAVGWTRFGAALAGLHAAAAPRARGPGAPSADLVSPYGYPRDNFLGPEPQPNAPTSTWPEFFRERRLLAMASRMRERGRWRGAWDRGLDNLARRLPDLLPERPQPALLHGDLWGGNAVALADGRFALVDPAAYLGHAEVDLAMTELFGGFPRAFYVGYTEVSPRDGDYAERRAVYQLYYLLMHLGLSMGYGERVGAVLSRYG